MITHKRKQQVEDQDSIILFFELYDLTNNTSQNKNNKNAMAGVWIHEHIHKSLTITPYDVRKGIRITIKNV